MGLLKSFNYWRRERITHNPAGRKLFRLHAPELSATQERVVADLRREGVARIAFDELLGEPSLWSELDGLMREFLASEKVVRSIDDYRAGRRDDLFKGFVIKYIDPPAPDTSRSPLLRFGLHPAILDTVNSYLGLCSKLNAVNLWYTIPCGDAAARQASQRWHRDPEDRHIVKVFVYFNDVDEEAGPFEYIPESRHGGRHAHLWRFAYGGGVGGYPPQEPIENTVPPADRRTMTGPRGSVLFCDTSGLHRGGFARSRERLLAAWAYVSPASLYARNYRVDDADDIDDLPPPAQYAVA
jgi:hypothetical protein